jgi:parallel beta-helix repeat protein
MRKLLIISLLFISIVVNATKYYVATGGGGTGTIGDPFGTLAQVNGYWFVPDDSILFNRGDTFYGTLTPAWAGSAGHPIVISAYGTGVDPIITGFTTLTSWTNEGGGIYSKTVVASSPEIVTIDGVQYGMGRFPDATWNAIDSRSTDVSITDADLNSAVTDWTGAEIVIRCNDWEIMRGEITGHTDQTITYTSQFHTTPPVGNGYFIQNDLRTLTAYGEWYYDGSKLYMYFGAVDPATKTVKISTVEDLITFAGGVHYITFDNISLKGANGRGMYISQNNYITVQNCDIDFCGITAIWNRVNNHTVITNTTINHSNEVGIVSASYADDITISYCNIYNSGMILGLGKNNTGSQSMTGIVAWQGKNYLLEYNNIINCGYIGISLGAGFEAGMNDGYMVRYNYINNVCSLGDDGAGIYCGLDASTSPNAQILHNIVLNSVGAPGGKYGGGLSGAGIYLDDGSDGNTLVHGNTVANISWAGIYIHNSLNITITDNTVFNCLQESIRFQENNPVLHEIRDMTMNNNIFFAKGATQATFWGRVEANANQFSLWGTFDNNYYARPIDDNQTFITLVNDWTEVPRTFAQWQSYSSQDVNSQKSPISIADTSLIDFYYNSTSSDSVITLPVRMIDVRGTVYPVRITLPAYGSAVLMPDPNAVGKLMRSPGGKILRSAGGKIIRH